MIPKDLETRVLRYHHVEKWPVGTIARELGVHHNTVRRVLHQAKVPQQAIASWWAASGSVSAVNPYLAVLTGNCLTSQTKK